MTFKSSLCAMDCIRHAPRFSDIDRTVSVQFQRASKCSKPWTAKDAPSASQTCRFDRSRRSRRGIPEPSQFVRGDRVQRRRKLLPKRFLVLLREMNRATFTIDLLHGYQELNRPRRQGAQQLGVAAEKHSEV